mmetsp:Transcript_31926/g.83353  ORF Transcript_31926/g.83353 Transcript_31926/m.83353 type:complete len:260 (-) Transcript_31926:2463-3242(-)
MPPIVGMCMSTITMSGRHSSALSSTRIVPSSSPSLVKPKEHSKSYPSENAAMFACITPILTNILTKDARMTISSSASATFKFAQSTSTIRTFLADAPTISLAASSARALAGDLVSLSSSSLRGLRREASGGVRALGERELSYERWLLSSSSPSPQHACLLFTPTVTFGCFSLALPSPSSSISSSFLPLFSLFLFFPPFSIISTSSSSSLHSSSLCLPPLPSISSSPSSLSSSSSFPPLSSSSDLLPDVSPTPLWLIFKS